MKNLFANFETIAQSRAIEFGVKGMIDKGDFAITFIELYILVIVAFLIEHGSEHYEKWEDEDLTVQMITEFSYVANASAVADRLVRKGWLTRQPCTEDRRYVFFNITETGRQLLESFEPEIEANLPERK